MAQTPDTGYAYSAPADHHSMIPVFQGKVLSSQAQLDDDQVVENTAQVEVTGNLQALSNTYHDVTTKSCIHQFGGIACGVAVSPAFGIITNLTSTRIDAELSAAVPVDIALYRFGNLKFLSGQFVGQETGLVSASLLSGTTYRFNLFASLRKLPKVGTPVVVANGCDQSLRTCNDSYNNILRSRALPFLQGGKVFLNASAIRRNP